MPNLNLKSEQKTSAKEEIGNVKIRGYERIELKNYGKNMKQIRPRSQDILSSSSSMYYKTLLQIIK